MEISPMLTAGLHEVFQTDAGCVHQSDNENCLYLTFSGKVARFEYATLIKLRNTVKKINIDNMLLNPCRIADIEIISVAQSDHYYILSALEILALRDLLEGTFVMFQLNHIIKDSLHRLVA
jgi:hypothetical protein